MKALLENLMPSRFKNRMALVFAALWVMVTVPAYLYVERLHKNQIISEKFQALNSLSKSASILIGENLIERKREIELLAQTPLYRNADFRSPDFRASLERLQSSYPNYSWIGLANVQGEVVAATQNMLSGVDVSKRPWFQEGAKGTFVGDLHEAILLAKLLKTESPDKPIQFIDFAAPVNNDRGELRGVLASHAHWRWARDVMSVINTENIKANGIDFFIVNASGDVIFPENSNNKINLPVFSQMRLASQGQMIAWSDGEHYLTAKSAIKEPVSGMELGWQVIARQDRDFVMSIVNGLERSVLISNALTGMLFLFMIWAGADRLARPVERLTQLAKNIQNSNKKLKAEGNFNSLEMQRLADALTSMSASLIDQRDALEENKKDLENIVAKRTAELQEINLNLDRLARTDALTGLSNRHEADLRLNIEFARYKRNEMPYSICVIDVDFFKKVNDTYGHSVGDMVLKEISSCIRKQIRSTDFLARIGGEEIWVLLPETTRDIAISVAEKIRSAVEQLRISPVDNVSVSIGVDQVQPDDLEAEDAVTRADVKLYQAKAQGRNRVVN